MSDCEEYKNLLGGLVDQELTQEESQRIHEHLRGCPSCRREYDELVRTGELIGGVAFSEPADDVLRNLWKSPYSRGIKLSGMLLMLAGWLTLVVYGLAEAFRDSSEPLLSRLAIGALIIGFFVLLAFVIRERVATYKVDKYKGVER